MAHIDPPFGARVPARRDAVLAVLRAATGPISAEDVAADLALHANTARFHLRALVADGLAEQTLSAPGSRGRPRVLYRARSTVGGDRSYVLLARMMAEAAAVSGDLHGAETTGRAWGERLLGEIGGTGDGREPERVAAHLTGVLDSIGFAPQVVAQADGLEVTLRHCPFLEVARVHPELVCGMHGALIQGVLDGLDSGMVVRRLLPFVATGGCVADLRATDPTQS